jgi:hypothetical protein
MTNDRKRKDKEENSNPSYQSGRDNFEQNNATSANIIVCPECREPYYAGTSHTCS